MNFAFMGHMWYQNDCNKPKIQLVKFERDTCDEKIVIVILVMTRAQL